MTEKLQKYYDASKKFEADLASTFSFDMDMISIPKYAVKQKNRLGGVIRMDRVPVMFYIRYQFVIAPEPKFTSEYAMVDLFCDANGLNWSVDEKIAAAGNIKRYRECKSKRDMAVKAGATELSTKEISMLLWGLRNKC